MDDQTPISPAAAALRAKCRSALDATDPQPTTVLQVREVINLVCEDVDWRIVQKLGDHYDVGTGTARGDIAFALHRERVARAQQGETLFQRVDRWMSTGQRVELGFANGLPGARGRGTVVGYYAQPSCVVLLDSGERTAWAADLLRETDQPLLAGDASVRPAEQARIVAESVDLRNPDWRANLRADVEGALRGTEIVELPVGHPAAVPADAPGDRDHTPTIARATTPGDDRGRELAERTERIRFNLASVEGLLPMDRAQIEAALTALERLADALRALAAPAETEAGCECGATTSARGVCGGRVVGGVCEDEAEHHGVAGMAPLTAPDDRLRALATPPAPEAGDPPTAQDVAALVANLEDVHGNAEDEDDATTLLAAMVALRKLSRAVSPPASGEGQGATEGGIARRGLGDPYPIAQAIDGVTADLDASLSPRVDLVRVLLDVANTYVDRLIVEARTWTTLAPAGPQAAGAGDGHSVRDRLAGDEGLTVGSDPTDDAARWTPDGGEQR